MASDPRFISGIHNYCDRWCERCPLTSRCTVFAMEQANQLDPSARDIQNAKFWEHLHGIFAQTKELLVEMAREQGIDWEAAIRDAPKSPRPRTPANHREVLKQARRYAGLVDKWFQRRRRLFPAKGRELRQTAKLGIESLDPVQDAAAIQDAVEVIRWYQHFIFVKLQRALRRELEDSEDDESAEFARSDMAGSTKVALIGIDHSLAAWAGLRDHFPDHADEILDLLVLLDRLRRAAESAVPDARAFVRPGFDTGDMPLAFAPGSLRAKQPNS